MTTNLNNVNLRDDTFLISKIQAHVFNQGANYTPLSNQFRISSVGYCMRKLQFDKIIPEHKQPFDMKAQGTFAVGNAVHEYIQEHLPDDILIKDEFQVNYTYNNIKLIGHIDLLIQTPDGIKLVDIKTSNPRSFGFLNRYGASKHHVIQANTYASIMNIETFSILYVCKSTFQMKEFTFLTNSEMFELTLEKLSTVYEYIKKQEVLNPLEDRPRNWECQYQERDHEGRKTGKFIRCGYFDICLKNMSYDDLTLKHPILDLFDE